MIKDDLRQELNQNPVSFDTLLLDLGIDYDKDELTPEEAEKVRAHLRGSQMALPETHVTDDDVLSIAEATGVDLDLVMQAAERLDHLEALVQWVEAYQKLVTSAEIEADAKQQFDIDRLEGKERELADRLSAALKRESPDFEEIRQRLGIELPESVTRLASWDGKPKGEGEPNFLKSARMSLKIQRGVA